MRAVVLALAASLTGSSEVTPVQKVIQLLQGMLETGKKEKHEEEVQFAAYSEWCDNAIEERQESIKKGNERIESLNADIQKFGADANRLGREVASHDAQVAGWQADSKASSMLREKENTDFRATEQDYAESVSALARATEVLKAQSHDRKQAASFIQELQKNPLIEAASHGKFAAFLALAGDGDADHLSVRAPEANAYEFQSGGVVELLEKLSDKFEQELYTLRKEEKNSAHAHQMLLQDLKAQIEEGQRQSQEKSVARAENLQSKANAQADLADTTATRDEDQKFLDETSATCAQKRSDYESRTTLRAEELVAIEKAIEILGGDEVSGTADRHLPALAQKQEKQKLLQRVLLQLRSLRTAQPLAPEVRQKHALTYLTKQAEKINSRMLSTLALRAAADTSADPFVKIKQMIQDMITRLLAEANAEAEEKAWCDEELTANKLTRDEKTSRVEKLFAQKDELNAEIALLSKEIVTLTKEVSRIDKDVADASKIRAEEKATNTQTIKEAKAAQDAIARALKVLQEFYAKAGLAEAFVQTKVAPAPGIFDSSYKGQQGESTGVIGLLEVIQTDFARLESTTEAEENESQNQHDAFLDLSSEDRAQKSADIEHKTNTKKKDQKKLSDTVEDLEGTQNELDKATKYYDSIKPRCVDPGVSYEDRVARRQEEIESLQEALRILEDES